MSAMQLTAEGVKSLARLEGRRMVVMFEKDGELWKFEVGKVDMPNLALAGQCALYDIIVCPSNSQGPLTQGAA